MRAGTPTLDRVTASDLFLLQWDHYGWCSDIGAFGILEGANLLDAAGRVEIDLVRRHVQSRLHLIPRFTQLLCKPRRGLGWPLWVDTPEVDISAHVRVRPLAPQAGEIELLEACAELAERPFDPARPLWELWLLPGLTHRQLGVYVKLHHVIADGAAALAVLGALFDLTPDTPSGDAPPSMPTAPPATGTLLRDNLIRRRNELHRGISGLVHPRRTLGRVRESLPAWREVLTEKPAPQTSLNHPVGNSRRLAVVRTSLDLTKRIAKAHEAKVNDVVLCAVAGGLRDLLAQRKENVAGLMQRAMVTITHQDDGSTAKAGNKPGWMMVSLPVGEHDVARRLAVIARETAARKHRARPEVGSGIFRFIAGQRAWYRMFPRQRSVNIVVSNLVGPPVPLYFAGARVLELCPMMPTMGNLTLVCGALSYDGQLSITAVGDLDHCPDLQTFAEGIECSLRELAESINAVDSSAFGLRPDLQAGLLPEAAIK